MTVEEHHRVEFLLEILKILLQSGNFIKTRDIHKQLFLRGLLSDTNPAGKERRKLNRALQFLESIGYAESKYPEIKGRKSQEWRANQRAFPVLTSITEEELTSLLTFSSFIPENYKHLEIFKPFVNLIKRLRKEFNREKLERIEFSFVYEPQFLEKFVDINQKELKMIYHAIIEGKSLIVSYKGSDFFKIQPLKVFVYNGIMYLCALIENKTFRTFHISGLKIIEEHPEKPDRFLFKKFRKTTFLFEEEKPFLFGARVAFKDSLSFFKNPLLFPTQFHLEKEEDRHFEVFLVGFTGYRFASRFLVEEIIEIISPNKQIINTAKQEKVTENYPELSYSLKENQKRFQSFLKTLDTLIKQRQKLIKTIKRKQRQ